MVYLFQSKNNEDQYEFITPLSIESCIEKMETPIRSGEYYGIRGKANELTFHIAYYPGYRNSFNRVLYGTFSKNEDNLTVMKGELKLDHGVKIVMFAVNILIILFMLIIYCMFIYDLYLGINSFTDTPPINLSRSFYF